MNIVVALTIGIVAGVIDVLPMVMKKCDRYACVSAFFHWVVLGLLIPYVRWEISPWLKGLLIAQLSAVPIMVMVYPQDRKAIFPIFLFSLVLGAAVGFLGDYFLV